MRDRPSRMLPLLLAALLALSNSQLFSAGGEIHGKSVTLTSDQSWVEFERIEWDPKQLLTVALRFATRSVNGQLMLIKGVVQETDVTAFELSVVLKQQDLSVYLYDDFHGLIARAESLKSDVANGEEKSVVLDLNLANKGLGITLASTSQARIPIDKPIPTDQKMDIVISLGSANDDSSDSIVGCVTLVSVFLGTPAPFVVKTKSDDVVDDCKDPCEHYNCNGGACINKFDKPSCDCFETNRHGAQCQTDSYSVAVTSEQYIRYNLDKDEQQPHRIAFDFKVEKDTIEGLLLHAPIGSKKNLYTGTLSIELIKNDNTSSINFAISDLITINFPDFPEGEEIFHDAVITFFYNMNEVQVMIDSEARSATWEMNETADELIFSGAIYFGGSADETANGIGFAGCLREPYVGYVAAITHLEKGSENTKVTSNGKLGTCEDGASPAATAAPENEEPAESDLSAEETAEQTPKEGAEEGEPSDNKPAKSSENDEYDATGDAIIPKVSVNMATGGNEEGDENDDDEASERKLPAEAEFDLFGLVDALQDSTTQPSLVTCDPNERFECRNGGTCKKDRNGVRSCACATGYIGIFCQFSDLPRSCQEAYDLGEKVPGVYKIDVDGSGSLEPTHVDCENGITTIPHNMPNSTEGRNYNANDQILPLTYRLFSPEQLRQLVKQSSDCIQYVRYDCIQAPLGFQEQQTWFESVAQPETTFARIGQTDHACPCFEDRQCQYNKNCNCDAGQQNSDEGYLQGFQAGITKVYVLQEQGQTSGRFTVGPLQCRGEAKSTNAVTIRSSDVSLPTGKWQGESISFWFRTSQSSALLASIASGGRHFRIYLSEGHLLEFRFNLNDRNVQDASFEHTASLLSQSRLNDSSWHRVRVNVRSNELRLGLDKQNTFYQLMGTEKLDKKTFDSPLIFGGDSTKKDGLVGCIKQLEIDDQPFDLMAAVRAVGNSSYLSETCQDFCNKEGNPCRNGAECIEGYEERSYICVCANPWIFSGRNCEKSVNSNSEVSFHDVVNGFLIYQNLNYNPLESTMVFSFRTDQSDAILAYAHDQFYNFVQVHLSEENKISLTLNNNRTVRRCTITAETGKEFSSMQWNQVLVIYGEKHTSLYVDRLLCIIDGPHTLSDSYITGFTEGLELLTVDPPMSPVAPSGGQLLPYTLLYAGGLPRPRRTAFRRLKRQVADRSFYGTAYPPILGCMRGFRIGDETVDLQYGGIRPKDQCQCDLIAFKQTWGTAGSDRFCEGRAVRLGCNTQCESLICENSGHCSVDWQNLDPSAMSATSCDCSKTSYFGERCSQDYGLTFEGQAAFVFDMIPVMQRYILPPQRKGDSFNFAFAATVDGIAKHSRYLAVLQFTNRMRLDIILNKNGSINAGLILPVLDTQVYTFIGNFSDGYRHFIQTTFQDKSVIVVVDSIKFIFNTQGYQVTLASAEKIYLGGFEPTNKTDGPKNYIGCMSNADINFHLGEQYRFAPFKYYRNTGEKLSEYATTVPIEQTLNFGSCATFKIPGAIPPPERNVHMPNWEAAFKPQPYQRTTTTSTEDSSGGFPWWIILIVIFIILIVVFVIVIFCCIRKRTADQESSRPTAGNIGQHVPADVHDEDLYKPVPTNKPNVYGDLHPIRDELLPLKSEVPADPQVHHPHYHHHQPQQQQHKTPPVCGSGQVQTNLDLPAANTHLEQTKRSKEQFLNKTPQPAGSWGSVLSSDTYYTAHEFGSQDELPPPPSDDEFFLQPVLADHVTPSPFERTSPARLSTFGDRTVPPDSPLHRPNVAPRQAKFVPVPTSPKL